MNETLAPCEHRARFMVIDLYQQREAICAYTQGWSKAEIVAWLSLYGEIHRSLVYEFGLPPPKPNMTFEADDYYVFISYCVGHPYYRWGFHFDENDELEVTPRTMWQSSQRPKILRR